MGNKHIRGKIEINFGMDNFCYIHTKNGRRVDLTEWMKKFDGKNVELDVFALEWANVRERFKYLLLL